MNALKLLLLFIIIYGFASNYANGQSYFKGPALIETPTVTITSAGTTTLTKDSQTVQNFTGSSTQTVELPDATTIPLGRYFEIWNDSTQAVTVEDAASSVLRTIPAGLRVKFVVKDIGSAAGTWIIEDLRASQVTNVPSGSVSSTNVQGAINEVSTDVDALTLRLLQATSTGVKEGLGLSPNIGTPSTFDIAPGIYDIIDLSDINNPVLVTVNYPGSTANVVTNLATHDVTYISLGSAGNIVQSTSYPSPSDRRDYAFVGRLNHSNRTTVTFTNTFPDYKISPVASFYDLVDAIAPFRLSDFSITANGANLSFDREAGQVFFRSENYLTNFKNPHIMSYNSQTLQPFRKITQTQTVDVADVTVIDPANYDVGGTVTSIGGATGRSTIQRVYLYKSGAVRVAYGQTVYDSFNDAVAAIGTDTAIENPTVSQTAVLLALIVVRRNCTSLLDTTCAKIVHTNRFGGTGGGAGGGAGDFQGTYENSVQPQITLNSTQNGVLVRDASTPIGATLLAIQNNAGTTNYLGVDVNGLATTNFVGTGTAGAVRVHNLTTTQKNALTPADGMIVYDTDLDKFQGVINGLWDDLGGAATLQEAYEASSSPQFVLNTTQDGLFINDNATPIGSTLFAVRDNAGTTSYLGVDVNGMTTTNFVGTGTTGAVRVHNLTTTQKNALTPALGMMVYDTTIGRLECYDGAWGPCTREVQSSDLTLTASDQIAIDLFKNQTYRVAGNTVNTIITIDDTPFGTSAPTDGLEITLIASDTDQPIELIYADVAKGCLLNGDALLTYGRSITLKYNSTMDRWIEKARNF